MIFMTSIKPLHVSLPECLFSSRLPPRSKRVGIWYLSWNCILRFVFYCILPSGFVGWYSQDIFIFSVPWTSQLTYSERTYEGLEFFSANCICHRVGRVSRFIDTVTLRAHQRNVFFLQENRDFCHFTITVK